MKKLMNLFSNKVKKINYSQVDINDIDIHEIPLLTAEELVDLLNLHNKIRRIQDKVAIDTYRFDELYRSSLYKYFESVQLIPASLNHHHSHLGGLIIHTLDVIELAIGIRNTYTLPRLADPDVQQKERHLWTYGVFVATLLHDVGKTLTQQSLTFLDTHQQFNPVDFQYSNQYYRMNLIDLQESYRLHETFAPMFFGILIPPKGQAWLTKNLNLLDQIFSYLKGDKRNEGIIGDIITEADMKSAAKDVGFEKINSLPFSKKSLRDRIIFAIKELIPTYTINSAGTANVYKKGGIAWFMSNALADDIRKFLSKQNEAVPSDNNKIFNEIQSSGIAITVKNRLVLTINIRSEKHDGTMFSHDGFKMIGLKVASVFDDSNIPDDMIGSIFCVEDPNLYPVKEKINKIDAISPFLQNLDNHQNSKSSSSNQTISKPAPKNTKKAVEPTLKKEPIAPKIIEEPTEPIVDDVLIAPNVIAEPIELIEPSVNDALIAPNSIEDPSTPPEINLDNFDENNEDLSFLDDLIDSQEDLHSFPEDLEFKIEANNDIIESITNDNSETSFHDQDISEEASVNNNQADSNSTATPGTLKLKLKGIEKFDASQFPIMPENPALNSPELFQIFKDWIRENLRIKRFILNDKSSPFHLISNELFGILAPRAYAIFIEDYGLQNVNHALLQRMFYKHKKFFQHEVPYTGKKQEVFTVKIINSDLVMKFNIITASEVLPYDLKVNINKSFILQEIPIEPAAILRDRAKKLARKKAKVQSQINQSETESNENE